MRIQALLVVAATTVAAFASGCASEASGADVSSVGEAVEVSGDDALAASDRSLVLNAARADLKANDLKGAALYRSGATISFVVSKFVQVGNVAYLQAHAMKRTVVRGRNVDTEITVAEYAGSPVAAYIADGMFDGPNYFAMFQKKAGRWVVATSAPTVGAAAGTFSAFGPTDAPMFYWTCSFPTLPYEAFGWSSKAYRDEACLADE